MLTDIFAGLSAKLARKLNREEFSAEALGTCLVEIDEAIRSCTYAVQDLKLIGRNSRRLERLRARYRAWRQALERCALSKGLSFDSPMAVATCRPEWLEARLALAIGETEEACRKLEGVDARVQAIIDQHAPGLIQESVIGEREAA